MSFSNSSWETSLYPARSPPPVGTEASTLPRSCSLPNSTSTIPSTPSPSTWPSHPSTPSSPARNSSPNHLSYLKFCCLNVRGLASNLCYIKYLLNHFPSDIIRLSELWLHNYNLHSNQQIHSHYKFIDHARNILSIYCAPFLIRGHGGEAIGWHSRIDLLLSPIPIISTHRISFKTTTYPTSTFPIFSAYLLSHSGFTDRFREVMDQLNATMDLLPSLTEVIILDNLNADPGCRGSPLSTTRENEQG